MSGLVLGRTYSLLFMLMRTSDDFHINVNVHSEGLYCRSCPPLHRPTYRSSTILKKVSISDGLDHISLHVDKFKNVTQDCAQLYLTLTTSVKNYWYQYD